MLVKQGMSFLIPSRQHWDSCTAEAMDQPQVRAMFSIPPITFLAWVSQPSVAVTKTPEKIDPEIALVSASGSCIELAGLSLG